MMLPSVDRAERSFPVFDYVAPSVEVIAPTLLSVTAVLTVLSALETGRTSEVTWQYYCTNPKLVRDSGGD